MILYIIHATINYQLSTINKSNADRHSIRLITPMLITSTTSLLLDTRIAVWVSRQMIPIHKLKTLEEDFCLPKMLEEELCVTFGQRV